MKKLTKFFTTERIKIIGIFAGIGLVVWLAWNYLKGKAKEKYSDVPIPEIPGGGYDITEEFKQKAEVIAAETFDVLDGVFTWAITKEKVFVQLMALSDGQLVYVYRVYNNKYYEKHKETMTESINAEFNTSISGVKSQLVNRLRNLKAI